MNGTEFINSIITTHNLGPIEDSIGDFWRMVWEQRSYVVVMLTKVFDFIRVMCCKYWPGEVGKKEIYGEMEVMVLSEEPLADFLIRTFKIRKVDDLVKKTKKMTVKDCGDKENDYPDDESDGRIVYQFHYTRWHTHSCPFPNSLLQFRRRIRIYMNEMAKEHNAGPTIVHCRLVNIDPKT